MWRVAPEKFYNFDNYCAQKRLFSCAHVPHSQFFVCRCAHEAKKICARPSKIVQFAQKKPEIK